MHKIKRLGSALVVAFALILTAACTLVFTACGSVQDNKDNAEPVVISLNLENYEYYFTTETSVQQTNSVVIGNAVTLYYYGAIPGIYDVTIFYTSGNAEHTLHLNAAGCGKVGYTTKMGGYHVTDVVGTITLY